MALLSVVGLHAGYGANEVIHGVDFAVEAGEAVAILGPNGCGKTTFVKALLGFVRVTRGSIRFDGADITPLSPTQRAGLGIGYVPQLANVFTPMTVRENLEMGGYRLSGAALGAALGRLFELFPLLEERAEQRAGTLSGGERQLLAMARAMMVSPRLLVLDEPSAGLSPARADEVFGYVTMIAGLWHRCGDRRAGCAAGARGLGAGLCAGHRPGRIPRLGARDRRRRAHPHRLSRRSPRARP